MFSPPVTSPDYDHLHLKLISLKNHGQCKLCRILGGSRNFCPEEIWTASWQNQQNACAPSEDSDQPGHPPSLIRVFALRMKKAQVLSYPMSAQQRFWSDWADAQADLSLRWAHSHIVGFVVRRLIIMYPVISLIFTIMRLCAHMFLHALKPAMP